MSATNSSSLAEDTTANADALPYVVSGDLGLLLAQWGKQSGFIAPDQEALREIRSAFCARMGQIFPHFEYLDELVLYDGLQKRVKSRNLPIVTMDRAYVTEGLHLDFSRTVTASRIDVGLAPRPGAQAPPFQYAEIANKLGGNRRVQLVDDVIFAGQGMLDAIENLRNHGVTVAGVCAAVGIGAGVDRVRPLVDFVDCVHEFPAVLDEICERDFYPGTPFSGRTQIAADNVGMPYVAPFGDVHQWAAIPMGEVDSFSRLCIELTIHLFEVIERGSNRVVRCCDLPRNVAGLPQGEQRFVEVLRTFL